MATNKRKEAAALFELIDKSTLKVPKHAGALKIPDWWSSKTNPSTDSNNSASDTPAKPIARTAFPAKTSPTPPTPASTETPSATGTARFFEPPPATATPAVSPSIRPPLPNGAARPAATPMPPVPADEAPPLRPTEPIAETELEDEAGVTRRSAPSRAVAAPARAASDWSSSHPHRMSRRPPWVMPGVIGAGVLFLLIVILVLVSGRHGNHSSAANRADDALSGATADHGTDNIPTGGLLPPPGQHPTMPAPVTNAGAPGVENDNAGGSGDTVSEGTTGKVYGPGTVQRSPDLYYVMISSTPSSAVAQKNADFLAHHGVDVSIEVVAGPGTKNNRWYKLISVKGFPSMVAAEPFRKQIVQIGHLHPDFKKYKKVWDDAFVTKVVSVK